MTPSVASGADKMATEVEVLVAEEYRAQSLYSYPYTWRQAWS